MSRDAILAKVRASLRARQGDAGRAEAVRQRLTQKPRGLIPARAAKSGPERTALFASFLTAQSARVIEVASAMEVPAATARFLRETNLPARIRTGSDPFIEGLPWAGEPSLERKTGRAEADDEVGLTHALAAVAETGTMLMASGPENPVTLNFMPESHIVVVEEKDLVGCYEDAWTMVRQRFGAGVMPRTINMVSGPSRTADIGGRVVQGAHGPRRMCIIIVRSPP
jgi:L-lactate dehydrogenase complex protein LldG